ISEEEQPLDTRAQKRVETEDRWRDQSSSQDTAPLSEAPQASPQASEPLPARPIVQPRSRSPRTVAFAPAQTEQQQQLNERSAAQSRELNSHELGDGQPHHAEQAPKRLNNQNAEFRARSGDHTEELGWDPRVKLPGISAERVWDRTLAERRPDVFRERPEDGPAFDDATLFDTASGDQANRDAAETRQAGLDARRAREEEDRVAAEENWDPDRMLRDVDEENEYLYGPSASAFTQAPVSPPSTSQAAHPPTTRGNKRGLNGEMIPNPSAPSASTTLREPPTTGPQTLISPNSPPESRPYSSSSKSDTDQHELSDDDADGDEGLDDGPPISDAELDDMPRRQREHDVECHDLMVAATDGVCERENCPWCPGADGKGDWRRNEWMNG
ncbi:MAG: hypothetical protein Q9228_007853, partial [Teloschistes exilis]